MAKCKNVAVLEWVDECARLCKPGNIVWTSPGKQLKELEATAVKSGELIRLDKKKLPGCVLHRSAQDDVARAEHLTFICTRKKEDSGHTNNWMAPGEAYKKLSGIFRGSMKGRTMYVIPFIMGPAKSHFSLAGVQLTDSIYVALNMHVLTRTGKAAMEHLNSSPVFTKCLHGKAGLDPGRRYICHFPEDDAIWSVGSEYGGNALLGKKSLALRIASWKARHENWMADHMFIVGLQNPEGKTHYIAGAFPSSCGKTNLAMIVPPESYRKAGWKAWTISDDIAWLRIGKDGRLWAVNAENGFFGVLPGTSIKTNPNAIKTMRKNTIFTNALMKDDRTVWWEGLGEPPAHGTDWKGDDWTPGSGGKGAHPNARFTAGISQCPSVPENWERPEGFPISAILFGGRRARLAPLVYQSFNWEHGVFVGATMASEKTAAQEGAQGELRRDPMAMLPFCGYNMGDYFGHWLKVGKGLANPPKIFHVNWFRTGADGKFMWPGFGENMRVLEWIIERCDGKGGAVETPIGFVPEKGALRTGGLGKIDMEEMLRVEPDEWKAEAASVRGFFSGFDRLPRELGRQLEQLEKRLEKS